MLARSLEGLRRSGLLRPVAVTAALLGLWLGYQAWLARVAAEVLPEALLAGPGPRVDLEVVLAVAPEQFHMTRLQALGRVMEVRERTAFIADVDKAEARAFAHAYWIERIAPWRR
jgi:hypothetical protein